MDLFNEITRKAIESVREQQEQHLKLVLDALNLTEEDITSTFPKIVRRISFEGNEEFIFNDGTPYGEKVLVFSNMRNEDLMHIDYNLPMQFSLVQDVWINERVKELILNK